MKKVVFLIIISLPAAWYLLTPGFYEPHDLHHIADIYQMVRAFQSGQFPPRLGPDFIFGYGYPLFNFYYIFPFYLAAAFFGLVGSLTLAYKLVFISSIFLSVVGMYLFLKELLGKWPAIIGSILFLYTPYRSVQVYVRGAMGEAFALAILPIFAWSIVRLIKNPRPVNVIIMGCVGSLFILSHNYFWVLSAPWLMALVLVVPSKRKALVLNRLVLGGLITLALSFYWWFPALIEQKLVSVTTPFPLIDHFPFIKQLIIPSWGYGASLWGPSDGFSFQIGIVNLVVIVFLVLFLKKFRSSKLFALAVWVVVGILVNLFMMNSRSYPIWKIIPFHDFIQFPWRLLSFTTFFSSVAAGLVVAALANQKQKIAGALIVVLSILLTINYFQPSGKYFKKDDDYLHRFFANRTISGESEEFSNEYLLYSEDYLQLPNWVEKRPSGFPADKITSETAKVFDVSQISPVSWEGKVESMEPAKIIFYALYFPGWQAQVDGKNVDLFPSKPYGQIEISVESGKHEVTFFWQETALRKFADVVSIGALLLVILIVIRERLKLKSYAR